MGFRRTAAIRAMLGSSSANDFMAAARLPLYAPTPLEPLVPGALPAMTRELIPWSKSLMPVDLVILWGIGDFPSDSECSSYYDPSSPWHNVFFGAYAMLSHKPDGTPWGYTAAGEPDFVEFLRIPALDYNYFTAGQFGCPPELMRFEVTGVNRQPQRDNGWDVVDATAQVPSGLHDPTQHSAVPGNYVAFGMPDPSFLTGRGSYDLVPMRGQYYMRRLSMPAGSPPITVVWGAVCPDTSAGTGLLGTIMQALRPHYLNAYA